MVTRFCVTSVPRSAGDDAITLGGVSSYHPPSGDPMRAQEDRRKKEKTTPPLNPLPGEGKRLRKLYLCSMLFIKDIYLD